MEIISWKIFQLVLDRSYESGRKQYAYDTYINDVISHKITKRHNIMIICKYFSLAIKAFRFNILQELNSLLGNLISFESENKKCQ